MADFDDIRPFNADEIPAATQRMADSEVIPAIAQYLGMPTEALRERIRSIKTLKEFQLGLLKEVLETLFAKTTTKFDWSGLENINEKKPYLFVSNHRDIVLDAMFLQYILNEAGQNTCQITFGSNLMCHPFVIDFGKVGTGLGLSIAKLIMDQHEQELTATSEPGMTEFAFTLKRAARPSGKKITER